MSPSWINNTRAIHHFVRRMLHLSFCSKLYAYSPVFATTKNDPTTLGGGGVVVCAHGQMRRSFNMCCSQVTSSVLQTTTPCAEVCYYSSTAVGIMMASNVWTLQVSQLVLFTTVGSPASALLVRRCCAQPSVWKGGGSWVVVLTKKATHIRGSCPPKLLFSFVFSSFRCVVSASSIPRDVPNIGTSHIVAQ